MRVSPNGFTLVEVLVVIGIITLLAAAIVPALSSGTRQAHKLVDQANLQWHHQQILLYQQKYGHLPRGTGAQFILDPWVRGIVDRNQTNFARYWTPGVDDERRIELEAMDPKSVWRDASKITSADTHYAGPSKAYRKRMRLNDGEQPLLANDNENGPAFRDHTVHVLMADGSVTKLHVDPHLMAYGFTGEAEDVFPIGSSSPHPLLQKLSR